MKETREESRVERIIYFQPRLSTDSVLRQLQKEI